MTRAAAIAAYPDRRHPARRYAPRPTDQPDRPGDHRRAFSRRRHEGDAVLDIDAEAPADIPSDVVDVVNADAKTLKFEQSGFS